MKKLSKSDRGYVHVHIDMHASCYHPPGHIKTVMKNACERASATIVDITEKTFPNEDDSYIRAGYTCLILLEESHMSVHTWPEDDYIAFDIFMCGEATHQKAIDHILNNINYEKVSVSKFARRKPQIEATNT